jgi:hypothetical protein
MASSPAEQRGQLTFALVVTLLALGYTTVGLRLWVRLRITKNPGWDDITMIITLVRLIDSHVRGVLTLP